MTQTASRRSRSDYQQFRAPSEDSSALIHPTNESLANLAQATFEKRHSNFTSISLAGEPLETVSILARQELVKLAYDWTSGYTEEPLNIPSQPCPIILSGHQPELYHPGVWFKNFLLDGLADRVAGTGINVIIDSDLCREVAVRVPHGNQSDRRVELVKYDDSTFQIPYEERVVQNQEFFESFAQRVTQKSEDLLSQKSIVNQIWPFVTKHVRQGQTIGHAFSIARHLFERQHGIQTLELPISQIADTDSFRRFLIEILSRAEEFQSAYNSALKDYRIAHGLRTPAQPLPNLRKEGEWIETPFWIWNVEESQRNPLWCRTTPEGIEVSDSQENKSIALISNDQDLALKQLGELRAAGIKVRSRALATTLYCRWVLADLFIHGIGGAKYDQVTDQISLQFFGEAPPQHATATATVRLFPPNSQEVSQEDISAIKQRIRGYRFHPETFLSDTQITPDIHQAIERKKDAIQIEKNPSNAHERHKQIDHANLILSQLLLEQAEIDQAELQRLSEELIRQPITTSREYSFVLFDKNKLFEQLQQLAREVII